MEMVCHRKISSLIENLSDALVLSFHQENHGRFIGILTAREHQISNQVDKENWHIWEKCPL